jgi:hypothetical protein
MVDAGALAEGLAEVSASPPVAQTAEKMGRAVRAATVAVWAQGSGGSLEVRGPALFFPMQLSAWSAQYARSSPPGLAPVWGPFVETYLEKLARMAEATG